MNAARIDFDARVMIQMLAVDVGHDREDGRKLQKRAVAFVRFHDQKIALADARVRSAHGRDFAADHHRGVHARMAQDGRDHRSGGGLAVTARDRDAVFQAHQFGEQFAARDHGNLQAARFLHFGIRFLDGGTDHQRLRAGHVLRIVAFVDGCAELRQAVGRGRKLQIRAGDRVTQIQQHFGDTAHPDSADPREVQMLP